jgi:hypothetical protein
MLLLVLLNTIGYYGFYIGLKTAHDTSFAEKLDDDVYAEADAITLKVALAVPYQTGLDEYQRVKGRFEKDGQTYQLVKQKLLRDTLYFVCVKDNQSNKINKDLADYVTTFSDTPISSQSSSTIKMFSTRIKDYITFKISIAHSCFGWENELTHQTSLLTFIPTFYSSIVHPPDCMSFS